MRIAVLQRFRTTRGRGCARGLPRCDTGVRVAGRLAPPLWCGRLKRMLRGKRCPHRRAVCDIGRRQRAVVATECAIGAATGTKIAQLQPIMVVA